MNYPLSKDKQGGPTDYLYRGFKVEVLRQYGGGFYGVDVYCTGSMYYAPDFRTGCVNRERFKKMMDCRIDSTTEETS